jgi:hypothetical protein
MEMVMEMGRVEVIEGEIIVDDSSPSRAVTTIVFVLQLQCQDYVMDDGGWSRAVVGPLLWLSSLIFQTPFFSSRTQSDRSRSCIIEICFILAS